MADVPDLDAYRFYETEWESYEHLREEFEWQVPEAFNIADYACDRHADGDGERIALYEKDADGNEATYTFAELRDRANRLANSLAADGIERGDRVAVTGAQRLETVLGYLAAWKLGAVVVPLSTHFQPDALRYRLDDSGAKAFLVGGASVEAFREVRDGLALDTVVAVDADVSGAVDFGTALEGRSDDFENAATDPEENAAIFYTSGTTGQPKGVVLPHRYLLGVLPSYAVSHTNLQPGGVFWSPTEWSWILFMGENVPALYYGKPSVAYERESFDPGDALRLIEKYGVTELFLPPTAIRMMIQDDPSGYDLGSVRLVESAGEPVGEYVHGWVTDTFENAVFHEVYGQTEAAVFIGDCEALGVEHKPGKMGVPGPGHDVRVLDLDTHEPLDEPGETGELALRAEGDPLPFKEYWKRPGKTAEKFSGEWMLTEDLATVDGDGYLEFKTRSDDVILSAGYKVGPGEVEETLDTHDAVLESGVIGVPDDERGEVPKAFVALAEGYEPSGELEEELMEYVRDRLARYAYPREIEFVGELPKTSTDKIRRHDLRVREGID